MGFGNRLKGIFGAGKKDGNEEIVDRPAEKDKDSPVLEKERNFKYLDGLIHSGNKSVTLDSDIILDDSEQSEYKDGIRLDADDLVIDANGNAIDACGKARIFRCYAKRVTIKNATFRNGFHVDGGAINNQKGGIVLENCTFKDNTAQEDGGAIINFAQITCRNVDFSTNIANQEAGGAISNQRNGKLFLEDCTFTNNTSKRDLGGAIISWGEVNLIGCEFNGNFAKKSGGAINVQDGVLDIQGGKFADNYSQKAGGAIINSGKVLINGATFSKNICRIDGGAIANLEGSILEISNSNFRANIADDSGGAMVNESSLHLADCSFEANSAKNNGGVIYTRKGALLKATGCAFANNIAKAGGGVLANFCNATFDDCSFTSNSSGGDVGGAIVSWADVNLNSCDFQENSSKKSGGAISIQDGVLSITGGKFTGNSASAGGAIINFGKVLLDGCSLSQNSAKVDGGALLNYEDCVLEASGCEFRQNTSEKLGGAIYNLGQGVLKGCRFVKNVTKGSGGAVKSKNDDDLMMSECEFVDNVDFEDRKKAPKQLRFKDLDELIHNRAARISLNSDYILADDEKDRYLKGITLDINNLVIDGNGHTIDARGLTGIFHLIASGVVLKNLTLKNGSAVDGGAIKCAKRTDVQIHDCTFIANSSREHGGAIYSWGDITLKNTTFSDNNAKYGGAVSSEGGTMTVSSCNFKDNKSEKSGGAIASWGNLDVNHSRFRNNKAGYGGGAISNEREWMVIRNSYLNENSAEDGGAIASWAEIEMHNVDIVKNTSYDGGGAINNQKNGNITCSDCKFIENSSKGNAGAILNFGKISLNGNVDFLKNTSRKDGGAINNQPNGEIICTNVNFKQNVSERLAGVILNYGKIVAKKTDFTGNVGRNGGGAIYANLVSVISCTECRFIGNESDSAGSSIYNDSDNAKFFKCEFSHHTGKRNVIMNKRDLTFIDCIFNDNTGLDSVIFSDEDSLVDISGGQIMDNSLEDSAIHTRAENFTISNAEFKNNVSKSSEYSCNVLNEGDLTIYSPKFNSNEYCVLNRNHIDAKKISHTEVESMIMNEDGGIVEEFLIPDEYGYDFSYLNGLICESGDNVITLQSDIQLENYERAFFDGGIELAEDGMVIDGNGHSIDADGKTRIFNVIADNVTIRNLTFKNGHASNRHAEHVAGGGAIKIIRNGCLTLENCRFIANSSDNDGGAIQNNGILHCKGNEYEANNSQYNGGAICNNNILHIRDDAYRDNGAKIAGAIYNSGRLTVAGDIALSGNVSGFRQDIYNADVMIIENAAIDCDENVYNTHEINMKKKGKLKSLGYLINEIKDSREITLQNDIKFEYGEMDTDEIEFEHGVEIDGNGHEIDFNHLNINFRIPYPAVFKNIVFRNAYVLRNSLFETDLNITFENVKFINNRLATDASLIHNSGGMIVLEDSAMFNNSAKDKPLISNDGRLEIRNSNFINNEGNAEGTVLGSERSNASNHVSIDTSLFMNNSSTNFGGVFFAHKSDNYTVENSQFIQNSSKMYGGAIVSMGEFNLSSCIFRGNSSYRGGAIYKFPTSPMEIADCEFVANVSKDPGGAIFAVRMQGLKTDNCTYRDNKPDGIYW